MRNRWKLTFGGVIIVVMALVMVLAGLSLVLNPSDMYHSTTTDPTQLEVVKAKNP